MAEQIESKQEIFNKVYIHLLTQQEKSVEDGRGCMYRGPNGLSCAVGCLITDEEYHPCMDGITPTPNGDRRLTNTSISHLIGAGIFPQRLIPHMSLLMDLQMIHDSTVVDYWEVKLKEFAKKANFSIPELPVSE